MIDASLPACCTQIESAACGMVSSTRVFGTVWLIDLFLSICSRYDKAHRDEVLSPTSELSCLVPFPFESLSFFSG